MVCLAFDADIHEYRQQSLWLSVYIKYMIIPQGFNIEIVLLKSGETYKEKR